MASKVLMRGFSKLPYDTLYYAACTNYYIACAEALSLSGSINDIQYIDIPNAIIVAIHYTV